MIRTINQCDICGADDSKGNPVCVRVSGLERDRQKPVESSVDFMTLRMMFGSVEAAPTVSLDLCRACAGGLVQLLRLARKRAEVAQRPQPSSEPLASALFVEESK